MNEDNYCKLIYEEAKMDWVFYPIARLFVDDLKKGLLPKEYLDSLNHKEINIEAKKTITIKNKGDARKLIDTIWKITEVAKYHKYKVKGNKMICPFHNDSDPSLVLNDKLNIYHCFGCNLSGDIIDFHKRIMALKPKLQDVKNGSQFRN